MPLLKTVIALLLATSLRAEALSDLRSALLPLRGGSAVSGTAEHTIYTRTRDGGDTREENGRIRASWAWNRGGLQLTFPEEVLDQAEREQRARRTDPDRPAPTRSALFHFTPLQVAEAIDFGTILMRELEGARLIQATRSAQETVLMLQLPPRLGKTERKHVRNEDIRMTVRLGPDGIPFAAERTIRIRARFFIISIENSSSDKWTLMRRNDRLIAIRREEMETSASMSREITIRSSTVLTLE